MKRVIIIGPFPNPISGVSLANKVVKEILQDSNFRVKSVNTSYPYFEESIGSFSFKKLFFYLSVNLKSLNVLSNDIVYITPGQTFFGVLKYSLFIMIASLFRKELIIHVHGNHLRNEYESLHGVRKRIFYFLVSKFTKGIVLSNLLRPNLTPFLSEEKIYAIPNFAESYLLDDNVSKDYGQLKVIYLSNLMKEKGIFQLLKSLKELELKKVSYKAKIAGNMSDDLAEELMNAIDDLEHVEYVGVVHGNEKKMLLDWGNVFVLPTFYKMEGQPISILEAMATENLIITTRHAGIPDVIVEGSNGYFVEKEDHQSITEILTYLAANKESVQKVAAHNKEYFLSNFTVKKFKEKLIQIL